MHFKASAYLIFALFGLTHAQDVDVNSELPPGPTNGPAGTAIPSTFITSRIPTSAPTNAVPVTRSTATLPVASGLPVRYWFSFGDSYTSSGFSVDYVQPGIQNPLGNPRNPSIPESHGPTWIPYVTTKYNTTLTLTYNFAVAGARITDLESLSESATAKSFRAQVETFSSRYASLPTHRTPWRQDPSTIYSIWIGINNVRDLYKASGNDTDIKIEELLSTQSTLLDELYFDVDAKAFLILNLPPLEAAPEVLNAGLKKAGYMKSLVAEWNTALSEKVEHFKREHPAATVAFVDTYTIVKKVLDNPSNYGFREDVRVYGRDMRLVWGDEFHLNTGVHEVLASEVGAVLERMVVARNTGTVASQLGAPELAL